ncbi:hypothetical protein [Citrobacter sp. CK205]|uniref:hypothetical protein n=1 Tax=Citrobacter sp. CK205 TaxID=2985114 RepID=UPI002577E3F4|nr:hypothetical protein [Citrobacter sp. CK205]MDM3132238.1 hypothetical protein [Citrobacter sp. CK205]
MSLCVMAENLLAKSRHRIEGDSVTAKLSALICENDEGNDEYMYWIELLDSEGEIMMKEVTTDFITASDTFERLKSTIGPAVE